MAIKDLGHPAFACHDLGASLAFYEKLGIKESFRLLHDDGSIMLIYLHIGGDRFIEVFPNGPEPAERGKQSFMHICLAVEGIEAFVEDIREKGIAIDIEPKMGLDFNTQAWITDPDGNKIELMEYSPESPQVAIRDGSAFPASDILVQNKSEGATMTQQLSIHFALTMTPTELPGVSAWANGFTLTKELTGDLIGTSEGLFINGGTTEGMRSYLVVEKITGTTAQGEEAGVVLEHGGIENDPDAWFGRIVPGTGTGAWEGLTGTVKYDSDDAGEFMVLTTR